MTHRVFSRNAGSSRARPSAKIIEQVRNEPWGPAHWGANQAGMQAHTELDELSMIHAKACWKMAAEEAANRATYMVEIGAHKQVVNRILEPYTFIDVVVTATDYANWFALRDHPAAYPEIQLLARGMRESMDASTPVLLRPGEWHLPYVDDQTCVEIYRYCKVGRITRDEPSAKEILAIAQKVSTARCARVSYKAFDGDTAPIKKELELYDKLLGSHPVHASPAEHQATPDTWYGEYTGWGSPEQHGNLTGWIQFRKSIPNEFVEG